MNPLDGSRLPTGDHVFVREPLQYIDGIPVFSRRDRYIDNYRQIAQEHLQSVQQGTGNPNIDEGLWLQMEESTRKLVCRYSAPGHHVLDAGVGLGRVLGPVPDLDRFGVDISLDYLRVARDNGFEVAFSRLEELPYADGMFDMVVACDVLEHVLDLNACCAQLIRVLKRGGVLIVRVPYLDDLNAYLDASLPYEYIHLRSFDLAGLRLHFEKIFFLEFVEHSFVAPCLKGHPRMKLRLLPDSNPARQLALQSDDPELEPLRQASTVSADAYMQWLYALRDNNPETFGQIASDLVEPLEINVVFRKP